MFAWATRRPSPSFLPEIQSQILAWTISYLPQRHLAQRGPDAPHLLLETHNLLGQDFWMFDCSDLHGRRVAHAVNPDIFFVTDYS